MSVHSVKKSDKPLPLNPSHVHLLGACGVGMVGLARLFLESGAQVTGSDQSVYPPMSDVLNDLGIKIVEGYHPKNLSELPELAIIGNVIRPENPEAREVIRLGMPYTSMAGALENYFLNGKKRLVVSGTHGKTTLTSMIAWILYDQGLDPGFFVGGIPTNFGFSSRLGRGNYFVIEGDEYDTAFFDKTPKFLHYRADLAIVSSIEFDHADIYQSIDQIKSQFLAFLSAMPAQGIVIACSDYETVRNVAEFSGRQTQHYGLKDGAEWTVRILEQRPNGLTVGIYLHDHFVCQGELPFVGTHNALNCLAAITTVSNLGLEPETAIKSMEKFRGVQRRQQIYEHESGVTIIDDFAHHPTAVKVTCEAVRSANPGKRVVAVFEPRTNTSRRSIFQRTYVDSFLSADLVVLREPPVGASDNSADLFSSRQLAKDINSRGGRAQAFDNGDQVLDYLLETVRAGDIVLIMSNGNFEGVRSRLLNQLGGGIL